MTLKRGPSGGFYGLGNVLAMQRDLLGFYCEAARVHGDACTYRVGPLQMVQLAHPDHHVQVLVEKSKSFRKPSRLRRVLGQWNGNGLAVNEGESWVRQRRLSAPAFKPQRLARYVEVVNRRSDAMLASWNAGDRVDVARDLQRVTLGVVAESLFGSNVERHTERFAREVATLNVDGLAELTSPVVLPLWSPTPRKTRIRRATEYLQRVASEMIAEHRSSPADHGDLLSALLHARDEEGDGTSMSDRQARDEAINLMLGGAETTATAIVWTLHLLSTHLDIQRRAREDVADVLGDRPPAWDDVPKLRRVEHAVLEAMRLYPPAYLLPREAIEDVEISGHTIPRDAQVTLLVYVTQRDTRWFDAPTEFRPERFENEASFERGAYLPFGLGPRACIGRTFAMTEAVCVLARILSRFELRATGPVEPEAQVSLHPKGGLVLALAAAPHPSSRRGQSSA